MVSKIKNEYFWSWLPPPLDQHWADGAGIYPPGKLFVMNATGPQENLNSLFPCFWSTILESQQTSVI